MCADLGQAQKPTNTYTNLTLTQKHKTHVLVMCGGENYEVFRDRSHRDFKDQVLSPLIEL